MNQEEEQLLNNTIKLLCKVIKDHNDITLESIKKGFYNNATIHATKIKILCDDILTNLETEGTK